MSQQINLTYRESSDWKTPTSFPDLKTAKEIAIDLETRDPNIKDKGPGWPTIDGNIVGVAVAADGFVGYYPIAHENGSNMDLKMVLDWVQDVVSGPGDKIFHNAPYDVGWLRAHGIRIKSGRIIDTMIAAALVDENRFSYSLNALGFDLLGETKSELELKQAADDWGVNAKGELYKLPAKFVGAYAEQDASLTLKLWQYLKTEITKQSLTDIFNTEIELLPILIEMRAVGVRVNLEEAEKLKKEFVTKEDKILLKIKKEAGVDVDIFAARSIAKAFDKLKIKYPLTEKSKEPSFTANWLLNCEFPIAKFIREAREVHKFHATFIDSILKFQHKGRIHAEIHQLRGDGGGTVSGRLSYSNPNLQQVPARNKELGTKIRSLFKPETGLQWGSFDYSQQEPRLVVHYASSIGFPGSDKLVEAYEKENADFHQTVAEMAGIPRSQAKTINLGIFYGMGARKLSNELGIETNEAKLLLQEYNQRVPFVKQLANRCMESAEKYGSIRTIRGRKCRFDKWEPMAWGLFKSETYESAIEKYGKNNIKRAGTYKALNRLIQGSAADQVKVAMIECYKAGYLPLIQIHDELCFNIRPAKDADEIKKIMEDCISELKVPSLVDVAIGKDWGSAHD
jgi:DNA polymerase I-like protein with 3'-5' exonuclease and polymerase domains|tara:strand:- start:323 stop:2194 length:1872 start_codon:yes stop_codon:yes gene_type:complete